MPKIPVPEKITRHHSTKTEKAIRLAVENRFRGDRYDETVPEEFDDEETRAYLWLCEVLRPADVLGEPDRHTMKLAAITIARLERLDQMAREDPDLLLNKFYNGARNGYISQYLKFCQQLCLSPGARAKVGSLVKNQKAAEDPLIKVLAK